LKSSAAGNPSSFYLCTLMHLGSWHNFCSQGPMLWFF
jgi:hypothetical protein